MSAIKEKYQFVTQSDQKWTAIAIEEGKYKGVIYKYGKVTVGDKENSEGTLPFRFEYDILDPYGLEQKDFGEEFFTLIGDILVDIIDDQLKEDSLEYTDAND